MKTLSWQAPTHAAIKIINPAFSSVCQHMIVACFSSHSLKLARKWREIMRDKWLVVVQSVQYPGTEMKSNICIFWILFMPVYSGYICGLNWSIYLHHKNQMTNAGASLGNIYFRHIYKGLEIFFKEELPAFFSSTLSTSPPSSPIIPPLACCNHSAFLLRLRPSITLWDLKCEHHRVMIGSRGCGHHGVKCSSCSRNSWWSEPCELRDGNRHLRWASLIA